MVSEIGKVTVQPLATSVRTAATPPPAGTPSSVVSSASAETLSASPQYTAISGDREVQGQQAARIREAQANLGGIQERLAEIKKTLVQIVKQFPPYPVGNPQRVEMMNLVQGLRKELDALTVPAPYRFPSQQQSVEADKLAQGQLPVPVAVVKSDLPLPAFDPQTTTDEEIVTALEQIEKLQKRVEQAEQGMWQDVVQFVGQADPAQVEDQSQSVRGYLANTPGVSIAHGNDRVLAAATAG